MEPLTPNKRFEIENRYLGAADDLAEYENILAQRANGTTPDGSCPHGARLKQLYDKLFGPTP